MRRIQVLGALLGWASLLLLYSTVYSGDQARLASGTINFFSYFTVLSNILVALAFTFPRRFAHRGLRGAIALYITVTCLIYFLLLRDMWDPKGIQRVTDITMHYILPPLYLLDWLRAPHRAQLRWRHAIYWLAFPLSFALYTLARGAMTGFYPYYFLNADAYGYGTVLLNMAGLTGVFLLIGATLIAVDRKHRS